MPKTQKSKKKPPDLGDPEVSERGESHVHSVDGIEYATVDEAEEAKRTSEDIVESEESEETEQTLP